MSSPAPTPPDADLVARAVRGDAQAFDQLVRRHYRAAFSLALGVLANRHDAEDVCQDAFVKALERLDDCREPSRFVQWLMVIVRNRALSYRSYRRIRETAELLPEIAEAPDSPAVDAARAELGERLERALATLSKAQREVVLLHDLEGWKHKEIADLLEMTEVRSRQHLFVARRLLRERLGQALLKEYSHE
ncbi:MAG TPA: sigma-70 family RNA polymerase sigma factor [Gemmatimonadaceae bacterium]|nr:sigma-70 family RNA polymerase sigma factor [Gemmatimonadaceae bacterium]